MSLTRAMFTAIVALIVTALTSQAQWKYETTENGEYRIGTNGRNVRVETNNTTIAFTLPNGWRLFDVTLDETGCKLTAGSSPRDHSFTFSIHRKLPPGVIDPEFFEHIGRLTVTAHDEDSFRLPDGRHLIPHHPVGEYRPGERYTSTPIDGAVLGLFLHEGEYNCAFEFTGSRLLGMPPSRAKIQTVLDTYVCTRTKRTDQAVKM